MSPLFLIRTAARQAKDFACADALRQSLATDGIEIMDSPRGTTWRVGDTSQVNKG